MLAFPDIGKGMYISLIVCLCVGAITVVVGACYLIYKLISWIIIGIQHS